MMDWNGEDRRNLKPKQQPASDEEINKVIKEIEKF